MLTASPVSLRVPEWPGNTMCRTPVSRYQARGNIYWARWATASDRPH